MGVSSMILHIDPKEGFFGKVTDSTNVSVCDIQYGPGVFSSYVCDNPVTVFLDIDSLKSITDKIKKGTRKNPAPLVSIEITEKDILVSVNGDTTVIPILDEKVVRKEPRVSFEFPEVTTVPQKEFLSAIKNAKKINDKSVLLIISNKTLMARSDSVFGDILVKFFNSDHNQVTGYFKTHFTPELLIDCVKGLYPDIPVTISTKTDYPIVLSQKTELTRISYGIAPRIKNDNDARRKKDPIWTGHIYDQVISPDLIPGYEFVPAVIEPARVIVPAVISPAEIVRDFSAKTPVNRYAYLRLVITEETLIQGPALPAMVPGGVPA